MELYEPCDKCKPYDDCDCHNGYRPVSLEDVLIRIADIVVDAQSHQEEMDDAWDSGFDAGLIAAGAES